MAGNIGTEGVAEPEAAQAGRSRRPRAALAIALAAVLAATGCTDFKMPRLNLSGGKTQEQAQTRDNGSVQLVERDVEAPDVFQVTEEGLWDGRPSLGGVWVAYPDVSEPERVIIRNESNGKFVIGALFRRERNTPGPKIQISSDAAAALEVLAGQPTLLNVTALRKEQVPETQLDEGTAPEEDVTAETLGPIAAAAAAIDAAEAKDAGASGAAAGSASPSTPPRARPTATATAAPPNGGQTAQSAARSNALAKPYVQIGIFSVEANATRNAKRLRSAGLNPVVKAQEIRGKKFWRVLAGPAANRSSLRELLKKLRGMGYADAYAVKG